MFRSILYAGGSNGTYLIEFLCSTFMRLILTSKFMQYSKIVPNNPKNRNTAVIALEIENMKFINYFDFHIFNYNWLT